jgi:hypothetical protein
VPKLSGKNVGNQEGVALGWSPAPGALRAPPLGGEIQKAQHQN